MAETRMKWAQVAFRAIHWSHYALILTGFVLGWTAAWLMAYLIVVYGLGPHAAY